MLGGQRRRRRRRHQPLHPHAVLDQVGDGDDRQPVLAPGELHQIGHARHAAIGLGDLADHAGRIQPRRPRQIDRRLGLPGPHQHATVAGPERQHVAGAGQIGRPGLRVDRGLDGRGAIGGRDAGGHAAARLDADAERGVERRGVAARRDLQRDVERVEPLGGHRHADQAAALGHHEVDRRRRHLLGGDGQVALVLPILVVDDDHHPAAANRLDRVLHGRELQRRPAWPADGTGRRTATRRLAGLGHGGLVTGAGDRAGPRSRTPARRTCRARRTRCSPCRRASGDRAWCASRCRG